MPRTRKRPGSWVVDGNKVDDFDFESINKRQLAGNIYLAKVTRVEPRCRRLSSSMAGNRHGFLAFSEIHPDYYQIPVADREALLEEERREADERRAREDEHENGGGQEQRQGRKRSRRKSRSAVTRAMQPLQVWKSSRSMMQAPTQAKRSPDDVPRGLEIADPDAVAEATPEAGPLVSLDPSASDEPGADADPVIEAVMEEPGDQAGSETTAAVEAEESPTEAVADEVPATVAENSEEPTGSVTTRS